MINHLTTDSGRVVMIKKSNEIADAVNRLIELTRFHAKYIEHLQKTMMDLLATISQMNKNKEEK